MRPRYRPLSMQVVLKWMIIVNGTKRIKSQIILVWFYHVLCILCSLTYQPEYIATHSLFFLTWSKHETNTDECIAWTTFLVPINEHWVSPRILLDQAFIFELGLSNDAHTHPPVNQFISTRNQNYLITSEGAKALFFCRVIWRPKPQSQR